MKRTTLALLLLSLSAAPSFANCSADQSAMMARINSLMAQAPSMSACHSVRALQKVYAEVLDYYQNCPAADPTNQMAPQIRSALSVAKQQAAAVCS